jgi:hypothetical protein
MSRSRRPYVICRRAEDLLSHIRGDQPALPPYIEEVREAALEASRRGVPVEEGRFWRMPVEERRFWRAIADLCDARVARYEADNERFIRSREQDARDAERYGIDDAPRGNR